MQKAKNFEQPKNIDEKLKISKPNEEKTFKVEKTKNSNALIKDNNGKEKEKENNDNKINIKPERKILSSYKNKEQKNEQILPSKDLNNQNKSNNMIDNNNNKNNTLPKPEKKIIETKNIKNVKTQITTKTTKSSTTTYLIKNTNNNDLNKDKEQYPEKKTQSTLYKNSKVVPPFTNPNTAKNRNSSTYVNTRDNLNNKKDESVQEKSTGTGNRPYKTFTYTTSSQEPLNSGRNNTSAVITSSKRGDNKNIEHKIVGRTHHVIELNGPVNGRALSSNKLLNPNKQDPELNNRRHHLITVTSTNDKNDKKGPNNIYSSHILTTINNKRDMNFLLDFHD